MSSYLLDYGESWHCMPFDETGYIWDTNFFSLSNYLKGSLLLISHFLPPLTSLLPMLQLRSFHSHYYSVNSLRPSINWYIQTYDGLTYDFPTSWWCKSDTQSSKDSTSDFEFWSFPRLVICNLILFSDAVQLSEDERWTLLQPSCLCTTILLFTFTTVFNTLSEMSNTLL